KIDEKLRNENNWQRKQREKKKPPKAKPSADSTPAETAAAGADVAAGQEAKVPDHNKKDVRADFDKEAKTRVGVTAQDIEEARKALEHEARQRPYKIDFFDDARGPFYEPAWEYGTRVVVKINRLHPFFTTLYARLLEPNADRQAKEAVDVLLIALARAEL